MSEVKAVHVFNLANDGFNICEGLRELGYPVHLIQNSRDFAACDYRWELHDIKVDPYNYDIHDIDDKYGLLPWVKMWWNEGMMWPTAVINLYRLTDHYKIRHLHSPSPIYLQFQPFLSKKINIIHEAGWGRQLFDPSFKDYRNKNTSAEKLARLSYSKANCIVMTNPDMYSFMTPHLKDKCGERRDVFIPFAINMDRFKPMKTNGHDGLLFFSPSRFNFKVKGNDKLLQAFRKFIEAGYKATLRLNDWGWSEDARKAKDYVEKWNLARYIQVVQPSAKPTLIRYYNEADMIFDQFILGSGGSILPEAMSCGKPVCIYLNEWNRACYGEMQPVLNAYSVDDIYRAMVHSTDPVVRRKLGSEARRFVENHHNHRKVASKFIQLYNALEDGVKHSFQNLYGEEVVGGELKK